MLQLIAVLLLAGSTAVAQGRPWNLPSEADFPNRYEGVMSTNVSNTDF